MTQKDSKYGIILSRYCYAHAVKNYPQKLVFLRLHLLEFNPPKKDNHLITVFILNGNGHLIRIERTDLYLNKARKTGLSYA